MASLFEAVQQFFVDEGWAPAPLDDEPTTLKMRYQGKEATWTCLARVDDGLGQVTFYSVMSGTIPEEHAAAVAELFARINGRIVAGNFELDYETDEARFKTSFEAGPAGLDGVPFARLFGRLVATNVEMMGKYLPALFRVTGGETPAQALENIGEL